MAIVLNILIEGIVVSEILKCKIKDKSKKIKGKSNFVFQNSFTLNTVVQKNILNWRKCGKFI